MKHTICLMTNWYPSEENPYRGVFFKEQAFAVAERFDFVVVRYTEVYGFGPWNRLRAGRRAEAGNTVEYEATVKVPFLLAAWDEIYSLYMKFSGKKRVDGVGKYVSPIRRRFTERMVARVFGHVNEHIDALYCVDGQLEAFQTACAAKMLGVPYVVGEHGPVPWPGTGVSDLNREAFQNADLFLAISQDKIRQVMLQNIRLPRTVYIGNLIDERTMTLPEGRPEGGPKTLLIVAAHSFYKNYDMFIDVMNRLTAMTRAPFRVLIVGYAANKGYSKGVEAFEAKIRASAFADRAELVREVAHADIASVYHRADALIMTSIQEGQPVSVMEAACCGLPAFSTRCGGVEDYLDADMGRVYAVNDAESMARDLKAFVEGELRFDAREIRRRVVARFGMEAFTRTFCEAFDGVIRHG